MSENTFPLDIFLTVLWATNTQLSETFLKSHLNITWNCLLEGP